MAYLMCQNVSLGEVSGCAKPLRQLVVERQVDVDLFVPRAVERTSRRFRCPTGRLHDIPEQDQLCVMISGSEYAFPGLLNIVQNERYELNAGLHSPVSGLID